MAIQFAGSSSTGGRRRRRIVVNGEAANTDASFSEGEGAEIESELVASAAAGPWVPISELRIWFYSGFVGTLLAALTFFMHRPIEVPEWMNRLTDHLISGTHPKLLVCIQSAFLILSAQLGLLINWYRAQSKLDFGGRYRVWPWAITLFAIAAFFRATETHRAVGQMAAATNWFSWRGTTTGWVLPLLFVALPVSLFLDRDIRNGRSSLWTLRVSAVLWLAVAGLEVFQPELQNQSWFASAHLFTPLYAAATLFVGLWHHARVVAYVCPDPPELRQRNVLVTLSAAAGWIVSRLIFWRRRAEPVEEENTTPKRSRKKKSEGEETAAKKKRKAPAKKATPRSRTRTKPVEEEVEEESSSDESAEAAADSDEGDTTNQDSWTDSQENWEQEVEETLAPDPVISETKSNGRTVQVQQAHSSAPPAPHSRRQQNHWEDESNEQEEDQPVARNVDSEEESDDDQEQFESGMSADQMRGLSKRQKRELKRQLRDQQRSRGR